MVEHRYDKSTFDHCVFIKKFSNSYFIILLLYLDDMMIVGCDSEKANKLKIELSKSFAVKE